jgi:hypothetical protein
VMLVMGLSIVAFVMLRYILSIPSFIRTLIMKKCWILLKAFSVFVDDHVVFVFASVNMPYYI